MKMKFDERDEEYYSIVEDLLEHEVFLELKNFTHHHSQTRYDHCISVSYNAYRLGKSMGLDYVSIARAGLLHDLFFYDTNSSSINNRLHLKNHPKIALENAKEITEVNDTMEDIILNHMMGVTLSRAKTKEGVLVSLVDKYMAISEVTRHISMIKMKNKNLYLVTRDLELYVKLKIRRRKLASETL